MKLSVRPYQKSDIPSIVGYFLDADSRFLYNMGVDPARLPDRKDWMNMIESELLLPYEQKSYYYVIWSQDGVPCGHSNINQIQFGLNARMHLHLWDVSKRKSGLGEQFVRLSIPHYFENFALKELFCEPNAYNPAPNKTLRKLGFDHLGSVEKNPGFINYHQLLNTYLLSRQQFEQMAKK